EMRVHSVVGFVALQSEGAIAMRTPPPAGDDKRIETAPAAEDGGVRAEGTNTHADQSARMRPSRRRRLLAVGILLALIVAGLIWAGPHLRTWYHFRAAQVEVQRCHNPQALRHLQVCLRDWPDDPDVLLLAARAERRALHYSEAGRLLEKYQQLRGLDD